MLKVRLTQGETIIEGFIDMQRNDFLALDGDTMRAEVLRAHNNRMASMTLVKTEPIVIDPAILSEVEILAEY